MALFDRSASGRDGDIVGSSDAATRALSVTVVENDFVAGVYEKLASVYDFTFGPSLHPGRIQAIQRMGIKPGDRILEVGVGTGINLALYPPGCAITGIDLSGPMLEKARERAGKKGIRDVRLLEMDAADIKFPNDAFDIVYAPYLISVVSDPVRVANEMCRVCRPGGKIIFLNHFRSPNPILSRIERLISPLTVHIGFKADLDLPGFLAQAALKPVSIEKVNVPRIFSLVTCIKNGSA
jgi:phosphatidylethanolamine/phosphatidyl-N-methylethanolamine N-methyltransferase